MRRVFGLALLLVLSATLSGCGNSNDAIAEKMIKAMNEMADAAESGDKAKIQAATTKFAELVKENKDKKMSAEENKRMEEKYRPQMEAAAKRMQEAMKKAMESGKITPQDMMSIGQSMMNMK